MEPVFTPFPGIHSKFYRDHPQGYEEARAYPIGDIDTVKVVLNFISFDV